MESAIAAHEFEKARFYSEEERKEKENLRVLRERYKLDDASTGIVTREDIEEVVSRWTGIAVTSIKEDEQQKLLRIEPELHKRVISQDKAITALARAIRRSRAGLKSPSRPVGCFFFLGPTGVGKTEVARRLAEFLFGSEKSLIRFDMSEFMEKHSVSKLIGAPPGYVGYEEGGQMTERVRRTPYSVILLDEIEKAHPDLFNILLQVFEDGQLTDGLGNTVDFRNTIIIMTSNIGARHLQKRTSIGFQAGIDEASLKSMEDLVLGEVKRAFNPEFLNRLDEIILFNPLGDEDLLRIEPELHKRVISQDKAITALARAIRRSRAGLKSPLRPVGCFFFLGPTGVGKTEVARRLAEFLFGSEKSLIRFDMSEFMEKHSVSKLIGAPPGYVGYEEGGQMTERVRRTPYSVILLDEIEKAHPDLFNILLQVFEDGQLTDGLGNTVDFRNTIVIMTSNIGARHLQKRTSIGFQAGVDEASLKSMEDLVLGEVKRAFNPEFLNRLDEVILFNPLGDEDLLRIIDLLVGQLNDTLIHRQVQVVLSPEARQWILEKTCADRNYGARPLRRALQKYVEDPLSEALIQGGIQRPATLQIYVAGEGLAFRPVGEATPVVH